MRQLRYPGKCRIQPHSQTQDEHQRRHRSSWVVWELSGPRVRNAELTPRSTGAHRPPRLETARRKSSEKRSHLSSAILSTWKTRTGGSAPVDIRPGRSPRGRLRRVSPRPWLSTTTLACWPSVPGSSGRGRKPPLSRGPHQMQRMDRNHNGTGIGTLSLSATLREAYPGQYTATGENPTTWTSESETHGAEASGAGPCPRAWNVEGARETSRGSRCLRISY